MTGADDAIFQNFATKFRQAQGARRHHALVLVRTYYVRTRSNILGLFVVGMARGAAAACSTLGLAGARPLAGALIQYHGMIPI